MPQFDTFSFFNQVTYVVIMFTLLFVFIDYAILPVLCLTLKTRAIKNMSTASVKNAFDNLNGLSAFGNSGVNYFRKCSMLYCFAFKLMNPKMINATLQYSMFSNGLYSWRAFFTKCLFRVGFVSFQTKIAPLATLSH